MVKIRTDWEDYSESLLTGVSNIPLTERKKISANSSLYHAQVYNLTKQLDKLLKNRSVSKEADDIFYIEQTAKGEKGVWATDEQLREAGFSDRAIQAHDLQHQISDMEYLGANANVVKPMRKEGYKMNQDGDFLKEINPKAVHTDSYGSMAIKFGDDILTSDTTPANRIDELIGQGYKLYQVHPFSTSYNKRNYTMVLTKDAPIYDVPDTILPYKAGGRRLYDERYRFAKVGQTIEVHGKKIRIDDKVLTASRSINRIDDYVKDYNNIMELYNNLKDSPEELSRALSSLQTKELNIKTITDLEDFISKNQIDTTMKAQVTKFNEPVIDYNEAPNRAYKDVEYNPAFTDKYMRGNRYFKERTNFVRDLDGKRVHLASVEEVYKQTIDRAVNNQTFIPMFQEWGDTFKSKFGKYIDIDKTGYRPEEVSGLHLLQTGVLKNIKSIDNPADRQMLRAAKNMQDVYNKVANIPTPGDEFIHSFVDTAVKRLLPRGWQNNKVVARLAESDPLAFFQAVSFRLALGIFNLAQLWKQGPHAILTAASMAPIDITRAILISPAVATALYFRKASPIMAHAARISGMSVEDFTKMIDWMEKRGTTHRLSSSAYLSSKSIHTPYKLDYIAMNVSNNAASIIIDTASFFKNKNKKFEDFTYYSDKLQLFPDRYAVSKIQRGSTRLLTQWLHYPMRWLEMMTGEVLTRREKVGLLLGSMAAYGTAGLLGREIYLQIYNMMGLDEETIHDNEFLSLASEGIITSVAAEYGYDIREGIAIGDMAARIFNTVNFMSEDFGKLPEIPAAAIHKQIPALYQAAKEIVAPSVGIRDELHFWRLLATTPYMPTGLKNAGNYVLALDARVMLDKYGDELKDNVTDRDAIMSLLGVKPIESRALTDAYKFANMEKEVVDKYYENFVKPAVDKLNTNMRSKSLPDVNRDFDEERRLWNETIKIISAGRAYINENHPEQLKYYNSLVSRAFNAGSESVTSRQRGIIGDIMKKRMEQLQGVR